MSAEGDKLRSTADWIKKVLPNGQFHYENVLAAAERADTEVPDE